MDPVSQGLDGTPLPAIFEYDGYDGGSEPSYFGQFIETSKYVVVHAGVRGPAARPASSRCSASSRPRTAPRWSSGSRQSWSNGDVGIYGHSYSATMGLLVAAQRRRTCAR